ncbi:cell division protein FtsQ/DivIB [Brumimicrobium sp.]|uniref:cell division protein FtsQ/DivIB n=1 Tax=Brumimicrobium sp. TaxID=2029867 RepID=UPI003A8D1953
MKKILKIVVLVVIFGGTVFLLIAANQKVNQQSMKSPVIDLTVQDGISLLTEKELLNELYTLRLFRDGLKKNELKIQEIEAYLENMNEVLTADVYTNLDDQWHIDVKTRRPIARVIANGVDDFYIDNEFQLMRLSPYAKPKILAFTGLEQLISVEMGYDEIINNDSLKTKSKMDQIYRISSYVCNDAFYNAQIVQVHYTKKDGFVLIPRVGEHRIIFGAAESDEMVEDKFRKLSTFYDEVIPYEGWNRYESINLRFKDQIVAKKKE